MSHKDQGMNWIRQEKRLAIYLRDGMACVYCGHAVEDGASLTLDHVVPRSQGGGNVACNLVTACMRCNVARGDRPVADFAAAVAQYIGAGATAEDISANVYRSVDVSLAPYRAEANALIARRGSVSRVLAGENMNCDKCGTPNADIGEHRHGKDICRVCLAEEDRAKDLARFEEEDRLEGV